MYRSGTLFALILIPHFNTLSISSIYISAALWKRRLSNRFNDIHGLCQKLISFGQFRMCNKWRCLLGNHVDRGHWCCTKLQWEHTGINHSQIFRPIYLELRVNHPTDFTGGPWQLCQLGEIESWHWTWCIWIWYDNAKTIEIKFTNIISCSSILTSCGGAKAPEIWEARDSDFVIVWIKRTICMTAQRYINQQHESRHLFPKLCEGSSP